jgi:hypothetical protein
VWCMMSATFQCRNSNYRPTKCWQNDGYKRETIWRQKIRLPLRSDFFAVGFFAFGYLTMHRKKPFYESALKSLFGFEQHSGPPPPTPPPTPPRVRRSAHFEGFISMISKRKFLNNWCELRKVPKGVNIILII